ncbi:hypothetical protein FRC04_009668 [Tulasnella sp. 424]|nr:hypothetical protein FRC04_009668 [Tulasnella sp. 424]
MADSNLPPSTSDIYEVVRCIRSISTILSNIFPHAEEPVRAHQNTRLPTLDNLSLLFVSGGPDGKDVIALTPRAENNYASQTPTGQARETPEAVDAFLKDPVLYCMERGVDNNSLEEHARNLQHLLRELYSTDERTPVQKGTSHLRLYIYGFCIAKVHSRFTAKIPGFEGSYRDFFLVDKEGKIGEIGQDDFNGGGKVSFNTPAPFGVRGRDEAWILPFLPTPNDVPGFRWKLSTGTPAVLDLQEDQGWYLWSFVGDVLRGLFKCIDYDNQNQRQRCQGLSSEQQRKRVDEMKDNLQMLDAMMDFLDSLVRASPTFWRLMAGMSDLLDKRRGYKTTNLPSSTNEFGDGCRIEYEAVDEDVERTLWGDQDSPPAQLRRWLKPLVQWHRAIAYLARGRKNLGILTQHLTITVSATPRPSAEASSKPKKDVGATRRF